MWKRLARPETRRAIGDVLGLDPALLSALDDGSEQPRVMAWLVGCCGASIAGVALSCACVLAACGLGGVLVALGALFAAVCTLNLMRLVHACAGLAARAKRARALVPSLLLLGVGVLLSQATSAALLGERLSLESAWQQHPWLAALTSLLLTAVISAPAVLRSALPAAARGFEQAQQRAIEKRIASQRDTCAELCDTLLAYELDRLRAITGE
ncbi:MAG: hypothetical protein ABW352_13680 [Polyangiales bacterium]